MKCSHCGGELFFENGVSVCGSCQTTHRLEGIFETVDVFLCCVENDSSGRRTKDGLIAAEIYRHLESKKISCFYERVSADTLIGDDLEIARHAALAHAKTVVLVGTDADRFEVLYEQYAKAAEGKTLIPVISGIKPEQLPEQWKTLQAVNYDSLGALNDLSASLLTILGREQEIRLDDLYQKQAKKKKALTVTLLALLGAVVLAAGVLAILLWPKGEETQDPATLTNEDIYNNAVQLTEEGRFLAAAAEFGKIPDYQDSAKRVKTIYDRYDGYYQSEDQPFSLYLNIVDGKSVELSLEKQIDGKTAKIEETLMLTDDQASGKYIDTLKNEGTVTVTLSDESVEVGVTTGTVKGDVSFGNIQAAFSLSEKTDRPAIKAVTKELLVSWVSSVTHVDDIKAAGFEVASLPDDMYGEWGPRYTIANTDVTIWTVSKAYPVDDTIPSYEKETVVAFVVPASVACPEKIGQDARVFSEKNVVFVPNVWETDINPQFFQGGKLGGYVNYDGAVTGFENDEVETVKSCLTVSADMSIGITSKTVVGEKHYNRILEENQKLYDAAAEYVRTGGNTPTTNADYQTGWYVVSESSGLNIRSEPSADSSKVGSYRDKTSVYVEDVVNNWGQTDKGWICLDYCTYSD